MTLTKGPASAVRRRSGRVRVRNDHELRIGHPIHVRGQRETPHESAVTPFRAMAHPPRPDVTADALWVLGRKRAGIE